MDQALVVASGIPATFTPTPPLRVGAPLAGWLLPLSEVHDPVFAERILGEGFAIDPSEATLRAPFDGIITSVHRAKHALTMRADNGAEILMHIGLDTVGLHGDGFTTHIAEGDRVAAGAPLIDFDMNALARRVRSLVVPVVITNGDAFTITAATTGCEVTAGEILIEIRPLATKEPAAPSLVAPDASIAVKRRAVTVSDRFGLHARPAGRIAAFAKTTPAALTVVRGDRRADAKSPTALMLLGAECGDVLTLEATGTDAGAAISQLVALFESEAPAAAVIPAAPPRAAAPSVPYAAGTVADLAGVPAAPGVAVGVSARLMLRTTRIVEAGAGIAVETAALAKARDITRAAITAEIVALGSASGSAGAIITAHLAFLDDPDLLTRAATSIEAGKSASFAWKTAINAQVTALRALGKPILTERAADLLDVQQRILLALAGRTDAPPQFGPDTILFAEDLLPSQFTALDLTQIVGIVLAEAGPTAHVAILAASKGIPTVVAVGPNALRVPDGETVLLDADAGSVRIGATAAVIETIRQAATARQAQAAADLATAKDACWTVDGTHIEVFANLGGPDDVAAALSNGAEGCGLMRSEFLFLNRATAPSEDEQLAQYQTIATGLQGRPLIVRTLDAGADKKVPYADLPTEENPALGMRGVRLSLARPDLLRSQIRAILRVTPHGQTRIMLPMIATIEDLRTVKQVVEAERTSLGRQMRADVGIMVEVPSVALLADIFAIEADFFSIGTNDLTQYTLAMDRGSASFVGRIDPLHPAVLRLIAMAVDGARSHGRRVGVCGALAALPLATPILIGLGVTELSVTPSAIPTIKARIRALTHKRCAEIADAAQRSDSAEAVRSLLANAWPVV